MTMLDFNFAETVPPSNFGAPNLEAREQSEARKERWIRYYGPAIAIMGTMLYVIHAWMAVA